MDVQALGRGLRILYACTEPLEQRKLLSTWTVTNLSDDDEGGTLHTLRWAIDQANSAGGDQTIDFDPSLNSSYPATIYLDGSPLVVENVGDGIADVTIDGPGEANLTINAQTESRVLDIDTDANASISGLTLTGGSAESAGCISDAGNLTLSSSVITGNTSSEYGVVCNYEEDGLLQLVNSTFDSNSGASDIFNEGELSIDDSTLTGNTGSGCIVNYGSAAISDSAITSNYSSNSGGAIFNDYNLTISGSTLSGNTAEYYGGAIYSEGDGELSISDSTLDANTAVFFGGAVYGWLSITNSTLTGNNSGHDGGAIETSHLTAIDCTISGNSSHNGGGIYGQSYSYYSLMAEQARAAIIPPAGELRPFSGLTGTQSTNESSGEETDDYSDESIVLSGSIVAVNTGGDLAGTGFSGTYNLIGDGSGGLSTDSSAHNIQGTTLDPIDPGLGSLAYNGGPTETLALLSGSPAIGAGDPADNTPDQRGFARFGGVDIGAYQSTFQIFNATSLSPGTYNFGGIGVPSMVVSGQYDGVSVFDSSGPNETVADELATAAAAGSGYLCFDVEGDPSGYSGDFYTGLIQLVTWAKDVDPNLKVGFYADVDGNNAYENIYQGDSLVQIQQTDLAFMGMRSGTYNEAEDVYRVSDFLCVADYPTNEGSWLDERIAELGAQDGQTYGAAREETVGGTEISIPQKPVYFIVSGNYSSPDPDSEGPMTAGDLQAILAQRALDSDGVILWTGSPPSGSFTDWFTGLTNFATQGTPTLSTPELTADANTMTLSWTDSDTTVQGFEIYRSVHGEDDWIKVGYTSADPSETMTWSDQQLQADITESGMPEDSTFDYKVRAITGISSVFSDSNIVDGDDSGIAPARDGYLDNLSVGWNGESDSAVVGSYTRASQEVEANYAPATNGGWLEYDNVDLSSGATSLDLNAVVFASSPEQTINVYYGAPPGTTGSVLAGSLVLSPTTSATYFTNLNLGDFGEETISVDIPTGTDSDIYIQFVSSSSTPNNYVWLSNWNFVA